MVKRRSNNKNVEKISKNNVDKYDTVLKSIEIIIDNNKKNYNNILITLDKRDANCSMIVEVFEIKEITSTVSRAVDLYDVLFEFKNKEELKDNYDYLYKFLKKNLGEECPFKFETDKHNWNYVIGKNIPKSKFGM